MLKLSSETKNNRSYDSVEGFNIFHILEGVFFRVDPNSLLPSDRVLVELYRYKYGHYSPNDEKGFIESTAENKCFNTWREAVEAYIYSYILIQRNNCNTFESLKDCTIEFLKQLKIIDTDLWDDELGFALGLTVKFQDDFIYEITNSIIKRANPIFKLNFYFGMKVREKWDKANLGELDSYEEAIKISSELALTQNFSVVRRAPALCFLKEDSVKNELTKEILSEAINTKFYSGLYGLTLSEDTLSSPDYNFSPTSLFRILMVFRTLGWNNLAMVPPDLVSQAEKLKLKNGNAIVMTKQELKMNKLYFFIIGAAITGVSLILYLKVGLYSILFPLLSYLVSYLIKIITKVKGD